MVVKICRITKHIGLKIQDLDFNAQKLPCTVLAAAAWLGCSWLYSTTNCSWLWMPSAPSSKIYSRIKVFLLITFFQTLLLCKLLNSAALATKQWIQLQKLELLSELHFLAAADYINLVVYWVVENTEAEVERLQVPSDSWSQGISLGFVILYLGQPGKIQYWSFLGGQTN